MTRLTVAVLVAIGAMTAHAQAQSFPDRPITLINPYAAGGPADLLARTVSDGMSEVLGRPVVVDNRPGAGTAIGAQARRLHAVHRRLALARDHARADEGCWIRRHRGVHANRHRRRRSQRADRAAGPSLQERAGTRRRRP